MYVANLGIVARETRFPSFFSYESALVSSPSFM